MTYPVFVYVQQPEVGVEQQLAWFQVYRWLSPTLVAEAPLRVDKAPKRWPCNKLLVSQYADIHGNKQQLTAFSKHNAFEASVRD
jgi:hypothetical protein